MTQEATSLVFLVHDIDKFSRRYPLRRAVLLHLIFKVQCKDDNRQVSIHLWHLLGIGSCPLLDGLNVTSSFDSGRMKEESILWRKNLDTPPLLIEFMFGTTELLH